MEKFVGTLAVVYVLAWLAFYSAIGYVVYKALVHYGVL